MAGPAPTSGLQKNQPLPQRRFCNTSTETTKYQRGSATAPQSGLNHAYDWRDEIDRQHIAFRPRRSRKRRMCVSIVGDACRFGFLGSCFEGSCAYAALFMVLPVTWFVLLRFMSWHCWSGDENLSGTEGSEIGKTAPPLPDVR